MNPEVVIVTGAGASVPFGLDTGYQLKRHVIESPLYSRASFDGSVLTNTLYHGMSRALKLSGQPSIDYWLSINDEKYVPYGKHAIADRLMRLEREAFLGQVIRGGRVWAHPCSDWHEWLFQRVFNKGPSASIRVHIVTFNYDRLLELSIRVMLMNSFALRPDSAKKIQEQYLPVTHVYGTFSDDSLWEHLGVITQHPNYGKFSPPLEDLSDADTKAASSTIQIMRHDSAEDHTSVLVKGLIMNSRHLRFIGFGFNPINIKSLGITFGNKEWKFRETRGSTCYACMYGTDARPRASLLQQLGYDTSSDAFKEKYFPVNQSCIEFLRNYGDFDV